MDFGSSEMGSEQTESNVDQAMQMDIGSSEMGSEQAEPNEIEAMQVDIGSSTNCEDSKPKVDRYGFSADDIFGWREGLYKSVPEGGFAGEYERVRSGNGNFINQTTVLGSNLAGTKTLDVPPMGFGTDLVCIHPRKCLTQRAAMLAAAKELSVMLGHHDVGQLKAWVGPSGEVREKVARSILNETPEIFCDNMVIKVLLTDVEKSANTKSERLGLSRGKIIKFLRSMKFQVSRALDEGPGYVCEQEDAGNDFFLKLLPNDFWKLSIADKPIEDVIFLLRVLRITAQFKGPEDLDKHENTSRMLMWASAQEPDRNRLKMTTTELLLSLSFATELEFVDIDLTVDVPGTLNCDSFREEMEMRFNLEFKGTSKCGLNCVSFKEFEEEGLCLRAKAYNKIFESIQQGSLRGEGIDCKIGYLLNPSTKRMRREFHDPEFYENGVTRLEITFKLSGHTRPSEKAGVPHMKKMEKLLRKYQQGLGLSTLVQCSIQESLAAHGRCMGRTIGVYFPGVFEKKRLLIEQEKEKTVITGKTKSNIIKRKLNSIPDGFVIRFRNSKTKKFNGFEIKSNINKRADRNRGGWDAMIRGLAWGSTCQETPLLLIEVDGGSQAGVQDLACKYFRPVPTSIIGHERRTNLTWSGDFKTGNYRNKCTDLAKIGVSPSEQDKLKLAVIDPATVPSYASMGCVDMEIGTGMDGPSEPSAVDSDELSAAVGYGRVVHSVLGHSGSLSEWNQWTGYKIVRVGRQRTPKLKFEVKKMMFWAPRRHCAAMIELLEQRDRNGEQTVVSVMMEGSDFKWKIDGQKERIFGKCQGAKAIPVATAPLAVQGGGEMNTGKSRSLFVHLELGRYFLPQSIKEQLVKLWGEDRIAASLDSDLANCMILHDRGDAGRVQGYKNAEEYMTILDCAGAILASNLPSKGKKRQRIA